MKKTILLPLLLLSLSCTAHPPAHTAPVIDGEVSPGEWHPAKAGLLKAGKSDEDKRFHYWVRSDATRLYFAVRRQIAGQLSQSRLKHDAPDLWKDDTVELFLSPHHSSSYYQLIFNPKGVCSDAFYHKGKRYSKWNPSLEKASVVKDGFWTIEVAVNLKDFNCTRSLGQRWGFNIVSNETTGSRSWSAVRLDGTAHDPKLFMPLTVPQAEQITPVFSDLSAQFFTVDGITLAIPICRKSPIIDGKIEEAEWNTSLNTRLYSESGEKPAKQLTCRLTQDKDNVYLLFAKDLSTKPRTSATKHDDPEIWKDDTLELFVSSQVDAESYYQIIVNPAGTQREAYFPIPQQPFEKWNPALSQASKVDDSKWVLELSIPWKAFDCEERRGKKWGLNIVSHDAGTRKYYYLQRTPKTAHNPAFFALLANPLGAAQDFIKGIYLLEKKEQARKLQAFRQKYPLSKELNTVRFMTAESPSKAKIWSGKRTREYASEGEWSMKKTFGHKKGSLSVYGGFPVWPDDLSPYKEIFFDVYNSSEKNYQLEFMIKDEYMYSHHYYYGMPRPPARFDGRPVRHGGYSRQEVKPGWNRVSIALDEMVKRCGVDLRYIHHLYIHLPGTSEEVDMYFDNMHLMRKKGKDGQLSSEWSKPKLEKSKKEKQLCVFESRREVWHWSWAGRKRLVQKNGVTQGAYAMEVIFGALKAGEYPGKFYFSLTPQKNLKLNEWSGYDSLKLDVYSRSKEQVKVWVSFTSGKGEKQKEIARYITVRSEANELSFDLKKLEEEGLDLSDVRRFGFRPGKNSNGEFDRMVFDNMRVVSDP